jgi:hypothetical protein
VARLTRREWEAWQAEVVAAVGYVAAHGPTVMRRDAAGRLVADGYPTASLRVGAGGRSGHSDPVGDLVAATDGAPRDLVHTARVRLERLMARVLDDVRGARGAVSQVLAVTPVPGADELGPPRCANPACQAVVAYPRAGRCEPCYRYRTRQRVERPRSLVEAAAARAGQRDNLDEGHPPTSGARSGRP